MPLGRGRSKLLATLLQPRRLREGWLAPRVSNVAFLDVVHVSHLFLAMLSHLFALGARVSEFTPSCGIMGIPTVTTLAFERLRRQNCRWRGAAA